MAFSDKLKNLTKQAQEAVAEHKDKIHDAVDAVSVAANEKTHGKYAAKITKFGQKASEAVEKLGGETPGEQTSAGDTGAAPSAPAAGPSSADAPASAAPSAGPTFDE
jgi:hypothetical protein